MTAPVTDSKQMSFGVLGY